MPISPYYTTEDGRITLYCGDCYDIIPTLGENTFDALVTDPPYPDLKGGMKRNLTGGVSKRKAVTLSVGTPWEADLDWTAYVEPAVRFGYIVFCSYHSVASIPASFPSATPVALVTWYKRNSIPTGKNAPRYSGEFVWLLAKQPGLKWGALKTTVFDIPGLQGGCMASERIKDTDGRCFHPTQKPVELMCRLVEVLPDGGNVLEPFAGTGTTLRACQLMGLRATGIEKEKKYCDIAVARLKMGRSFGGLVGGHKRGFFKEANK